MRIARPEYFSMVPTTGNDPVSLGYQPSALPLSYAGIVRVYVSCPTLRSLTVTPFG